MQWCDMWFSCKWSPGPESRQGAGFKTVQWGLSFSLKARCLGCPDVLWNQSAMNKYLNTLKSYTPARLKPEIYEDRSSVTEDRSSYLHLYIYYSHCCCCLPRSSLWEATENEKNRYKFRNAFVAHTVSFIVTSIFKCLKKKNKLHKLQRP